MSLKFCRLIKRTLLFTTGSPRLGRHSDLARQVLRQPDLDQHERAEYEETWTRSRWSVALMVAWYGYVSFKFTLVVLMTLRGADHARPERNLELLSRPGERQFRFNCLATNCSRPIGGRQSAHLAHDLKRLPHLWLCRPELTGALLESLWSPWDALDSVTLLVHAFLIVMAATFGLVYPLTMASLAGPNELLMFTVAPRATRALVCNRLARLRRHLAASYLNFRTASIGMLPTGSRMALPSSRLGAARRNKPALRSSNLAADSAEQLEQYALDCLPAIRTDWWRQQVAGLTSSAYVISFSITVFTGFMFLSVYVMGQRWYAKTMDTFAREMGRQNCAIWLQSNNQPIDVRRPLFGFGLYAIAEYGITILTLNLIFAGLLSSYYATIVELQLYILELQLKLIVATEMLKLRSSNVSALTSSTKASSFNMSLIRDKMIQLASQNRSSFLRFTLDHFACSSSLADEVPHHQKPQTRLESKLLYQMYALKLMAEHEDGAHVECVEKVYTSFRLFMELVEHYGRLTAPLVFFAHALTYTLAAIGVYLTRNVRDFTSEPLLIAAALMVFVSILSSFGALIHSKATRLVPLIWSLLAQISAGDEPKLDHLHLLWLKLEDMIEHEGGIYLKGFGARFDYINIVQLSLGISTIMILALKD